MARPGTSNLLGYWGQCKLECALVDEDVQAAQLLDAFMYSTRQVLWLRQVGHNGHPVLQLAGLQCTRVLLTSGLPCHSNA